MAFARSLSLILLFLCLGISGSSLGFTRCHSRRPSSSSPSSMGVSTAIGRSRPDINKKYSIFALRWRVTQWIKCKIKWSDKFIFLLTKKYSTYSLQSGRPDLLQENSGNEGWERRWPHQVPEKTRGKRNLELNQVNQPTHKINQPALKNQPSISKHQTTSQNQPINLQIVVDRNWFFDGCSRYLREQDISLNSTKSACLWN